MQVPDEKRWKLYPKSENMIFMGYSLDQKGYKCFNPSSCQTRIRQDVVFDKAASWYSPAPIYTENEEPSDATNPSLEDEVWISVVADTDKEEGLKSLELTGPESSNSYNTTRNGGEMSRSQHSQRKNKGKMPAQKNALTMSSLDLHNLIRSTNRECGDPVARTLGVTNSVR